MTLTHGLDPAKVRDIATRMMATSRKLGDVSSEGTATVQALGEAWEGPDLVEFSGHWNHYRGTIDHTTESISRFADLLNEQVRQQEETSGAGGGVGPGGGVSGTGPGQGRNPFQRAMDTINDILDGDVKTAFDTLKKGYKKLKALALIKGLLSGASWLDKFKLLSKYLDPGDVVRALGRIGPMTAKEAAALAKASGPLKTLSRFAGKIFGPLGVVTGISDLAEGIRNGDWLTAVQGGAGIVGGAAVTALAFGGAAIAGTAAAPFIAGAAVIGGAVVAGIEIWKNREAIWNGLQAAGGYVKDLVTNPGQTISTTVDAIKDTAGSVLGGIKDGLAGVFG